MSAPQTNTTPAYDRFGWYWQPAQWLQSMQPQDAIAATRQAINLNEKSKALKAQAAFIEAKAAKTRAAREKILKSLDD